MKRSLTAFIGLLFLQTAAHSQVLEELGDITNTVEADKITMTQGLGGQISHISYQACAECPLVRLAATSDLYIRYRARDLSPVEALAYQGQGGGVKVDIASGKVIELSFY